MSSRQAEDVQEEHVVLCEATYSSYGVKSHVCRGGVRLLRNGAKPIRSAILTIKKSWQDSNV